MSFNGFISYSHAADGRLAPAVQRGLHRLAKPWHRRRALWIFRDQTGLAVTPGLWSSIQGALDGSEWFVLLASPEAARSKWVNREIEHWVSTKSAGRILPVVTDGEWSWDPESGDFAEGSTAVPAALRGVFAEEPLFLDLRWARDDLHLNLRHSRFRDAIAQLAAPMHGVSKDELEGEDVRQHRVARRLRAAAVSALVVFAGAALLAGVLASRNADRATASAAEAVRQQQLALEQRGNAERFAGQARTQEANARTQERRAKDAAAETRRQEDNAAKQAENARTQQGLADRAAARAKAQERLAGQQRAAARQAGVDAALQRRIAVEQGRLAAEAAEDARRLTRVAEEQAKLAEAAAEDAHTQQANAEKQQRIAIGRRLTNHAKAIAKEETQTALMLGVAAAKVQSDDEARRQLAGLVTSTQYAGSLNKVLDAEYIADDVLLTQASDYTLRLSNVANRAAPTRIAELGAYQEWAVSPDGRTVAAAVNGQSHAVLLDLTKPSDPVVRAEVPVSSQVLNLTFSPDGRTLFVGTWDAAAKDGGDLWDVSDLRKPKPLALQFADAWVDAVTFSPDGNALVILDSFGATGVWDLTSRTEVKLVATLAEPVGAERVRAIAFLRESPILVAGCNGHLLLIDLSNPADPTLARTISSGDVHSVVVSADGRRLVRGDADGLVTLFELGASDPVQLRPLTAVRDLQGLQSMALSPDGGTLVTVDWDDIATLWNTSEYSAPKSQADLTGGGEQGLAAAYTPDGRSMLTVGTNPQAVLWDVTSPSAPVQRATPVIHDKKIRAAAITPDGRTVAAGAHGRVRVSDLTDPAQPVIVAEFTEKSAWGGYDDELVISPDGRTVAVGSRAGTVAVWDVTRGRAPTRLGVLADSKMPVAFSPSDRTLAATNRDRAATSLWTLDGPSGPARLKGLGASEKSTIQTIAFSPDGRTVAMGDYKTVDLWDVSQARPRPSGRFTPPGPASSVVFSRDSRTVAAVDWSQATLWDYAEGADPVQVAAVPLVTQRVWSYRVAAAFSPDGRAMTTSGTHLMATHGTATVWDLTKLAEVRADPSVQACVMTGRGLTEDEWARYIPELDYQPTCTG